MLSNAPQCDCFRGVPAYTCTLVVEWDAIAVYKERGFEWPLAKNCGQFQGGAWRFVDEPQEDGPASVIYERDVCVIPKIRTDRGKRTQTKRIKRRHKFHLLLSKVELIANGGSRRIHTIDDNIKVCGASRFRHGRACAGWAQL
jgi:hypothetical protein